MIIKILPSSGNDFHGVQYNDKKVENGKGELMLMKNFPSFINEESSKEQVRDYFKSISNNKRVKNPQFHAVISTKFQEHSKEELTKVAENFMNDLGYGEQPFIAVFHKDTENNHIHIVSTRVSKETGKKIKDSYEKLKAQKALKNTLERLYGLNVEKDLNKLLSYKFSSIAQLELLLKRNGFKLLANKQDETAIDILKNGINEKTIYGNQITFNNERNHHREKQIKAILNKYKEIYSTQVFITEDNRENEGLIPGEKNAEKKGQVKIEFESELQKKMKDMFGLDIVFNNKDNKTPFGYTIIDHKSQKIFKGSDIIKMNNLFEFTEDKIDKRTFESLKDFNVIDENSKKILLNYFAKNGVKDFMLFENKKRKDWETFKKIQSDFREYSKTQQNPNVSIIKGDDGKFYAIHEKYHYVSELKTIIGDKDYQTFINPSINEQETTTKNQKANEIIEGIKNIGKEFLRSSGTGTGKDHFRTNDELLKRKRKKRK